MKIFKNYIYNATYQIIAIIIPIIIVPYISRTLGSEAIGINSYTNSIMTYFVLFANLGMTVYGNRAISYYRDSVLERSIKFWEIIIIKLIMGVLSFSSLIIFIQFYKNYQTFLMLQSIQIFAATIDISWFFAGLEEFKKTVTRNIIVKVLSTIAIFIFVHSPEDLGIYIFLLAFSIFIGNLTLWTYIKKYIQKVALPKLDITKHIGPVFVLFIPQIATIIFMTMNKIVLGNLSTLSQTGFFDNSDKVVRILLAFITAIGTIIFPRIANSFAKRDTKLVDFYLSLAFNMVNLVSFPVIAGLVSVSKPISIIYFGSNFNGIDIVLATLSLELIFMGWSSVIGSQFLVAIDRTVGLTVSLVVSVIISLICSFILIPRYGAIGAAISSVIGEGIIAFIQLWYASKYTNIRKLFSEVHLYFISSVIMYACCKFSTIIITGNFFKIVSQGIIGIFVYTTCILIFKPKSVQYLFEEFYKKNKIKS